MSETSPPLPAEVDGVNRIFHDDLLDRLVGKWNVTGQVMGRPLQHRCDAAWTLNHQFLKVHFLDVSPRTEKERRRRARYEAQVFIGYDNMSERYVVHWLDVFGGRFAETLGFGRRLGRGKGGGNSIRFVFEYPDGPLHNTFSWNPRSRTWSIVIRQKDEAGRWTNFAKQTLRRGR